MIHTLDFIYDLRRDAGARESVLHWLEPPAEELARLIRKVCEEV